MKHYICHDTDKKPVERQAQLRTLEKIAIGLIMSDEEESKVAPYKPKIKIVGPGIMTVESSELLKSEKIKEQYRLLKDEDFLKVLFAKP